MLLGCKQKSVIPPTAGSHEVSPAKAAVTAQPVAAPAKPTEPVSIGHVQVKIAELAEPVEMELQFYPYTEDEGDFSSPTEGRQFFTKLLFTVNGKVHEIRSKYTLMSLAPPHHPRQVNDDFDTPGLPFDPSRFFRSGEYQDLDGQHTLLFFEGWAYASDPGSVVVIGFCKTGEPYVVLESEMLEVSEFLPGHDDTPTRIGGHPSFSEVVAGDGGNGSKAPYALTYDPLAVYVLSTATGKATYSLQESRTYNEEHYVWAGSRVSEDYAVLYNIPGHNRSFGASTNEAKKIVDAATKSR